MSLTDVRVLYELAHRRASVAQRDLVRDLGLDAGYLSRILAPLRRRTAGSRASRSPRDARQSVLRADRGRPRRLRAAAAEIARRGRRPARRRCAPPQRQQLVDAMGTRRSAARPAQPPASTPGRRAARPGAGRHRLGGAAARRGLCARIRLEQRVRGAGGRHRGASSCASSSPSGRRAGSPSSTASGWARSSWCASRPPAAQLRMLILAPAGARPGPGRHA